MGDGIHLIGHGILPIGVGIILIGDGTTGPTILGIRIITGATGTHTTLTTTGTPTGITWATESMAVVTVWVLQPTATDATA